LQLARPPSAAADLLPLALDLLGAVEQLDDAVACPSATAREREVVARVGLGELAAARQPGDGLLEQRQRLLVAPAFISSKPWSFSSGGLSPAAPARRRASGAVVGSGAVVTVWTTVVPGSVTVSFTSGASPSRVPLAVGAGEQGRGEDAGEERRPGEQKGESGTRCGVRAGERGRQADDRVVPAARSSASRSACDESAREPKRCSGSFASPRARTSSSSGGSSGFVAEAGGIGALTCAIASAVGTSRSNGRLPVSSSKATTARA
jgi:hypothetical protein